VPGDSVHSRTLRKAMTIVGGADELALRVGVAPPIIGAWLAGRITMPTSYFLKLVDIVMNDERLEHGLTEPKREERRAR
jgi:hypothetical protein